MRIGIYGGTFSPIHNGHVSSAKAFMEQMWIDVLFVIPTATSPHKEMFSGVSCTDRLTMCELAFRGVEGIIVSDIEIRRGGTSYTIDTLRALSQGEFASEENRIFMLCGTDMMLSLDEWREAEEIFKLCYPVYVRRENDGFLDQQIINKNTQYKEKFGKIVTKITAPTIEISSREIRQKIKNNEDVSEYIPQDVLKYIIEKGLYLNE